MLVTRRSVLRLGSNSQKVTLTTRNENNEQHVHTYTEKKGAG